MLTDKIEEEFDLLERHIKMLGVIMEDEPIGIIRLSEKTGFPHHKVRYSLRILEKEKLIEPSPKGAITTDEINRFLNEFGDSLEKMVKMLTEMKKFVSRGSSGGRATD